MHIKHTEETKIIQKLFEYRRLDKLCNGVLNNCNPLRRFTGDFKKNFLLKFMKNILQYTIDYPNVTNRKKSGVTDSGF